MRFISRIVIFWTVFCLLVLFTQFFWRAHFDAIIGRNQNDDIQKRLPSALIIGVKKGGTRALIDALEMHPQIVPAKREVHFFDNESLYEKGLQWYREQMPLAAENQIVIEKTPAYLTKHICAERVYKFNPHIKLLVIVREPVIRIISDFSQLVYNRLHAKEPLPRFDQVAFNSNGTPNYSFRPISNSLYAKHLNFWLDYFPLSQFMFVDGDKFIKDPMTELKKVETFLGLNHNIEESQIVFNKRKGFFCFRQKTRETARCLGESKGRKHFEINETLRQQLTDSFRSPNEEFFKLINRRFNW